MSRVKKINGKGYGVLISKSYNELVQENSALRRDNKRLLRAGDKLHGFLIDFIVENRISSPYLNRLDNGWVDAVRKEIK